jgi:hypothetical protein
MLAVLVLAALAPAQVQAPRLRWQAGQVLVYKVEQTTQAIETVGGAKAETNTRLNLTKRWQVLSVDAAGVATVQLSLQALSMETKSPSGETVAFNSASLDKPAADKAAQALRDQLSKFIGPPLAVLRVDAIGRVVEVKESKFGSASRYEAELPFGCVLSEVPVAVGGQWTRLYSLTLAPPQGTGEKIAAMQTMSCKTITPTSLTVTLTTNLKEPPATAAARLPLLQYLPQGEIVFDLQTGRLQSSNLRIDRDEKGQQGEDSAYHLTSVYSEVYIGDR